MDTLEILKAGIVNAPKESLSYDKIIKGTLAQSGELTVRFISGLLDDDIPLDMEHRLFRRSEGDAQYPDNSAF